MAAHIWATPSASPLHSWLRVGDGVGADDLAERLHIYRGGYPSRLRDALAESYPAIAYLLGDDAFTELAGRYAGTVPMTSYNLNHAGAQLPAFLRGDELSGARPYLPELAKLEWRVSAAFHARESAPLDPRTMSWSVAEWAKARLRFQPAVAVLSSRWPLLDLWTAREQSLSPADVPLRRAWQHLIVRRAGLIVRCESVSAAELRILRLLLAGRSLGASIERLEREGVEAETVFACFARWATAGMIAGAVSFE